jgi:hypothetical protein
VDSTKSNFLCSNVNVHNNHLTLLKRDATFSLVIALKNPELFTDPPTKTSDRARKQTKEQAAKAARISEHAIHEVFNYWKQQISPKSRAVLDHHRRQRIGWAIHDYGIEACKQAIDGILKSAWHMGQNPGNKKYNDIDVIFRDCDKVEKFIELAGQRDARNDFINNPNW